MTLSGFLTMRWMVPAIAVVVAASSAWDMSRALTSKAAAQTAVVESVLQWQQGVKAVASSADRWSKVYTAESAVQDLVGLLTQLKIEETGVSIDVDKVFVQAIKEEKYQHMEIGLTKVCLASADGGDSMAVSAPDYRQLIAGLQQLAARPQLYIGAIVIAGEKKQPVALLTDFCVLVRS